jgi:hypothetical protein
MILVPKTTIGFYQDYVPMKNTVNIYTIRRCTKQNFMDLQKHISGKANGSKHIYIFVNIRPSKKLFLPQMSSINADFDHAARVYNANFI